jgi:hypothetical protein
MRPLLAEVVVELALQGPILTKSSEPRPWGIDAVCARDAWDRLYLPGPLVKGKLREAYDEVDGEPFQRSRDDDLKRAQHHDQRDRQVETEVTVSDGTDADSGQPPQERYPALFYDFIAGDHWPGPGERTIARTAIDFSSGAARKVALRVIDCPVAAGEVIRFRGQIRFYAGSEAEVHSIRDSLLRTLAWIPGFGGEQSTGFGRLKSIDLVQTRHIDCRAEENPPISGLWKTADEHQVSQVIIDWQPLDPL